MQYFTKTSSFQWINFVKLKRDLKYRGHVYFKPVCPHIIYQALSYLKSHNKFYECISVTKGLSGEDMFNFSDVNENQEEAEGVTENGILDGKEMNKIIMKIQVEQNMLQLKIL